VRKSMRKSAAVASFGVEGLERRQLLSASLSVSQSLMVFNAVENSAASPTETLTLTDTGNAALSLTGVSIVDDPTATAGGSAHFSVLNASAVPTTLQAGGSLTLDLDYTATATGIDAADLDIASSDPVNPTQVISLHGIGTAGLGGTNQPSLLRILEAYDIPTQVGETDASTSLYPNPPAGNSQEVSMQQLVAANPDDPVTIDVLASFTNSTAKPYILGYYSPGNPAAKTQLFYTPTAESQSVYVQPDGITSFEPGSARFGMYYYSSGFGYYGYSEDALNTFDTTNDRKFRFFPMESPGGTVVPNEYIMTSTDYDAPAGYDFTNIVAIISNVEAAPSANAGPVINVAHSNAIPGSSTLMFNTILDQNATVGDTVHNENTVTISNTGTSALTVTSATLSDTTNWQLVSPPSFPLTIADGASATLTVKFIATTVPSNLPYNETDGTPNPTAGGVYSASLTIVSNDPVTPTTTLPLEGYFQTHSEDIEEPSEQTIVNLLAGYSTDINPTPIPDLNESESENTSPTYYGEEVVSSYWAEADSTQPVSVTQLAAFHTQGQSSAFYYYAQGSTTTHQILDVNSDSGQSLFPLANGQTYSATGSFTATGNFGFAVIGGGPTVDSDDSLNTDSDFIGGGHDMRFYPVRDSAGNLVPNTYIVLQDYPDGDVQNYDFQDNAYIVTNIHPVTTTTVTSPQTTGAAPAVATVAAVANANGTNSLQWVPLYGDSTIVGYNVYSSQSATSGYGLLNTTPLTTTTYTDADPLAGTTVYYRVTAVDATGESLGTQTSVVTAGTAPTGLQSVAVNETPTGSTTTVTAGSAYTIVAGGPGIASTADGFRYVYDEQTGNFDVDLQVNSLTVAGNFSTAGIMARTNLGDASPNVYMSASPANYRFKYRTTSGATENIAFAGATSFPNVWVRLVRAGNVFSGYSSPDGVTWTLVSQQTVALPSTLYLGIAVASNTTAITTTASVSNYGTTTIYTGPDTKAATYTAVTGQPTQESVLASALDPVGTIEPSTFTITTPPNHGGTATFNPTTGLLTYTSAAGYVGAETLYYTVADSAGNVSAPTEITFNVNAGGPVTAAESYQAVAGVAVVLPILAADTDATGTINPASVVIVTPPGSGGTAVVNATTGAVTYTAPATFTATDTFSYTVADSNGAISSPATVTITVSPRTSGLVTNPVATTAIAGVATTINVLSSDSDSTGTIVPSSVAIVAAPNQGGTATANANGTITYTAAPTYAGTETFEYTVTDSNGAVSAATLVTVTVSNPSLAPIASDVTSAATANGTATVNVVPSVDSSVGLNLSTLTVVTAPAHGTATANADGTVTFTPTANYVGPDSFTYTVADTNGHTSNVATVTVNVGVMVGTGAGDDRSLSFATGGGVATVTLNRGSAELFFSSAAALAVAKNGRATVTGTNLEISGVTLTGTTAASVLGVAVAGAATVSVADVTDTGALGTISGPKVILRGSIDLAGVNAIRVADINGAQVQVGSGTAAVSITGGVVDDSTLVSAVPVKLLSVTSWTSDDGTTTGVTAPSIGTLSDRGAFDADLTLTGSGADLNAASIGGQLGAVAWRLTGSARSIAAASTATGFSASVGAALSTLTVRSGGFGGTLTAGALGTATFTGGLTGTVTAATAKTLHVVGNVTGATLAFTGTGTSLGTLSATGTLTGTTLTTAGSIGTISAATLSGDTVLAGAAAGTTLATAAPADIGTASINAVRVASRAANGFADTSVIASTINSAVLGNVDTSNGGVPTGVAVTAAKSITGIADGTLIRFGKASTATVRFSDFEIELVAG
jgi:hypothetical protein